ncbi:hypothetical protein [Nocardia sp. NPDC005998]|uniref:hypothetical protein n=1 Tax=Nocardia sp. NPDC005998 TaxID=3156894 RepID=UPI0033A0B4E9
MVVNGMLYRLRISRPWRDLPERFAPWQINGVHCAQNSVQNEWRVGLACRAISLRFLLWLMRW